MNDKEKNDMVCEGLKNWNHVEFSKQEEAYRRGYHQGFSAARENYDLDISEVAEWRYGNSETAPPGSGLEGMHLHGLKKEETHRFFVNRLDKEHKSE